MLSTIWAIFHPYLLEIFKQKADQVGKSNKWKRGAIGDFMALYDTLIELEEASRAAYDEFADIGFKGGAIARIVVTARLDRLRSASQGFVKGARKVHNLLSIYNDELAIELTGAREMKWRAWCELEAWLDVLPSNLDEERSSTPIIRFSKVLPTKRFAISLGQRVEYPTLPQAALEREAEAVKPDHLSV